MAIPGPATCPCCDGRLVKLGETITETLEVIPRQWKVVQTVREKFSCRTCKTITQPPAPFHPIARGRAGPKLLAMTLEATFEQHLPLNRQSESYALEGIHLDVSTLGDRATAYRQGRGGIDYEAASMIGRTWDMVSIPGADRCGW